MPSLPCCIPLALSCALVCHDQNIIVFHRLVLTPALLRPSRGVKRHQHLFIARPFSHFASTLTLKLKHSSVKGGGGWDFTGAVLDIEKVTVTAITILRHWEMTPTRVPELYRKRPSYPGANVARERFVNNIKVFIVSAASS